MMIFLNLLLGLFLSPALSATCSQGKNAIMFSNGMFNDRVGATESLLYIWSTYSSKYPTSKITQYGLAYNSDERLLSQLWEVYRQKVQDSGISFWKSLANITLTSGASEYRDVIQSYLKEERIHDQDLEEQIRDYEKLLSKDYNVVTVAHSQGNLYTLFAFESIGSHSTHMISVATPASDVYGDGPYFTFHSDGVIKNVPSALAPNFHRRIPGWFDHEFITHYMQDPIVGRKVLEEIKFAFDIERPRNGSMDPQDGYFNTDTDKVLNWFAKYIKDERKLSIPECIVVESIFSIYARHGVSCEKRKFESIRQAVADCSKRGSEEGGDETYCPYYSGMDFSNPYKWFYPSEAQEHYLLNPHCDMNYTDFDKVRMRATGEALSILKTLR